MNVDERPPPQDPPALIIEIDDPDAAPIPPPAPVPPSTPTLADCSVSSKTLVHDVFLFNYLNILQNDFVY